MQIKCWSCAEPYTVDALITIDKGNVKTEASCPQCGAPAEKPVSELLPDPDYTEPDQGELDEEWVERVEAKTKGKGKKVNG